MSADRALLRQLRLRSKTMDRRCHRSRLVQEGAGSVMCGLSWDRLVRPASPGRGLCVLAVALCVMFGVTSAASAAHARTRSFPLGTLADQPIGVTTGPGGDLWVTQFQASRVLGGSTAGAV